MAKKNCSIMLKRKIKVTLELNNKQRKSTIYQSQLFLA